MPSAAQAFLSSWSFPPWATFALCVTWFFYFRGWRRIRGTRAHQFPVWRLGCFTAGLLWLWIALASPLDAFGNLLLTAHMAQHLVFMSIAPPLILLGAPVAPMLRGLPRWLVRDVLGPFFSMQWLRSAGGIITSPAFAWIAFNAAFLGWHVPAAYELALRSNAWHVTEHACFFLTSLLFWFVVLQPWPAKSYRSRWVVLPFLVSADIVNTGFSAFLCFCGRIVYPSYAQAPRIFHLSPLNDQAAAGAFMWVIGSVAFLIPAAGITFRLLSPSPQYVTSKVTNQRHARPRPVTSTVRPRQPFDLLRAPAVGAFLHSRYGRQSLQAFTLVIALAVIVDGLTGHPMPAMNLAGVIPWNYARSLAIIGLIAAGNLSCMACPFTLPRELGKRLGLATRGWPRALRNKWLSAGLLIVFFWSYEVFAIWDHPSRTAWLLIAYFGAALLLDTFFRDASFCKYVCPVGQFTMVSSLLSPLGVKVRSQSTCSSCRTHDCIAGNQRQRGCELQLFLPQKISNLDCTLCMDCVKACPSDNIGIFAASPAHDLIRDPAQPVPASSIGRLSSRIDIAMVALLIVASSFASAAVMVAPVGRWMGQIARQVPATMLQRLLSASLAVLMPGVLLGAVALAVSAGRRLEQKQGHAKVRADSKEAFLPRKSLHSYFRPHYTHPAFALSRSSSLHERLCRFSLALLPLGVGMWAAHLLFHLLTGWSSLIPALQQVALDLKIGHEMRIVPAAALFQPDTLLALQLLSLDAGLLLSLYIGWRIAKQLAGTLRIAAATFVPWAAVVALLYAGGVWTLLQPMQTRNMMQM